MSGTLPPGGWREPGGAPNASREPGGAPSGWREPAVAPNNGWPAPGAAPNGRSDASPNNWPAPSAAPSGWRQPGGTPAWEHADSPAWAGVRRSSGAQPPSFPPPPRGAVPGAPGPIPGGASALSAAPGKRRSSGLGRAVALALVAALVAGTLGGVGGAWWGARTALESAAPQSAAPIEPVPEAAPPPPAQPGSTTDTASKVLPSTVTIQLEAGGTGSGFILDDSGLIMTNSHVIAGADGRAIRVIFDDGRRTTAEVVGASPSYDIAVIRVEPPGELVPVTLGDVRNVRVGDGTIAVGAPLGLGGSVTSGIVSALQRPVAVGGGARGESSDQQAFLDAIQTDAAINPGNSGGPLVDTAGRVIGVNSAILSLGGGADGQPGGNIGVGFAIPINQAKAIGDELIRTGKSSYPVIGASVANTEDETGVSLRTVTPGGPADDAGLRDGQVVTAIDGQEVRTMVEFIVRVRSKRPGDEVVLKVRGGSDATVRLGAVEE